MPEEKEDDINIKLDKDNKYKCFNVVNQPPKTIKIMKKQSRIVRNSIILIFIQSFGSKNLKLNIIFFQKIKSKYLEEDVEVLRLQ